MSTEIKLPWGGEIICHDLSRVKETYESVRKFYNECMEFHTWMYKMRVSAYRCNDWWVDREKKIVTFFNDEMVPGYYWSNPELKVGDLIFLGDVHSGGQFAVVEELVDVNEDRIKARYSLLDEFIE